MYGWMWRQLPGSTPVRVVLSVVIATAVVATLFLVVFPWAVTWLPGQDVLVERP